MEEDNAVILLPTTIFIKSEPTDFDFEEEKIITPVDVNQITSRTPKPKRKPKKKTDKVWECKPCGKIYGAAYHLTRHNMSSHGERNFKCDQCERSFTLKSYLKKHMITHTGERRHRCEVCNKSFTQRGSLNLHKLIHTGQKNYLCTYCNKPFTHQAGLNIHILIHTSNTKYPCELCRKTFKQKKSMKYHMQFFCKRRPDYTPPPPRKKRTSKLEENSVKDEIQSDDEYSKTDDLHDTNNEICSDSDPLGNQNNTEILKTILN